MKIYYLKPQSGLRTSYRSDTLWGMICWGIKELYGEEELIDFLKSYNTSDPDLVISSAFPFREEGKYLYEYFPRPLLPISPDKDHGLKNMDLQLIRKEMDAVEHLERDSFFDFALEREEWSVVLKGTAVTQNYAQERAPHKEDRTRVHITMDRLKSKVLDLESSGQLLHDEEYELSTAIGPDRQEGDPCGLAFFAKGRFLDRLDPIISYLGRVGMGGNRSVGKGFFEVKVEPFPFPENPDANAMMNLSLYWPRKEELINFQKGGHFHYELEERKGWVRFSGVQKPKTLMFREGSLFPLPKEENDIPGQTKRIISQEPSRGIFHPIYRYGHALMFPVTISDQT